MMMASQNYQGSIDAPIQIPDSDDEIDIVDLTAEEDKLGLDNPATASLQLPVTNSTKFPVSYVLNPPFNHPQPLDSVKHSFSPKGLRALPLTGDAENPSTSINDLPLEVNIYKSIETGQSILQDNYTGRPRIRRSLRPSQNATPKPSDGAGEASSGAKFAETQKVNGDSREGNSAMPSKEVIAMEEILRSIKRNMEQDHASFANSELLDASKRSRQLQECLPDFTNEVDPFANLPPIESSKSNKTDTEEANDEDGEPFEIPEQVPKYKHYITTTRSFLVPDNRKLAFLPYVGPDVNITEHQKNSWLKGLKEHYDEPEDPQASRQRENVDRLREYLPSMLEKSGLTREAVVSHMTENGYEVAPTSTNPVASFSFAFENTFATKIQVVIPEIAENLNISKKSKGVLGEAKKPDLVKQMLSIHLKSCPVCHVYACGNHGVYENDSSEDEDEYDESNNGASKASNSGEYINNDIGYADLNMTYESLKHRNNEGSAPFAPLPIYKDEIPCSPECFTIEGLVRGKCLPWKTDDITYFQALFLGMHNQPRASCLFAPLLRRPCYDVHDLAVSLTPEASGSSRQVEGDEGKLDWYDNKGKEILVADYGNYTKTHRHEERSQPTGCDHPGISCYKAGHDCMCFRENILCDKFCGCSQDCYMKFTGCNCPQSENACLLKDCPCQLLNRECDPDLCHTCGAAETLDPYKRHEDRPAKSCHNTDIQRGIRAPLLIGESTHPAHIGYGAFAATAIPKDAYIGEYVGEIISMAEADRRGELYHPAQVSFFFNLNAEVVIDSYRYGHLERFINHSKHHRNCSPRVKLVNGEHRIGFWAAVDIGAGAELWFDYGEDFVRTQGLKEMPRVARERAKKGGARPVVRHGEAEEGGEEVDVVLAFGGDAISKTEPAFLDEYEDDVDDDDLPIFGPARRRPRRHVRRPRKYTG